MREVEASSRDLAGAAEQASSRSSQAVTQHLRRVTEEIEGANAALRGTAEAATRQSSDALAALFESLSRDLDASAAGLRSTLENGAHVSVTSLASTGDRLRGELAVVLEKLGQTGAALDRVVASASGRLGEIQGDLGDRVLDLQRALVDDLDACDRSRPHHRRHPRRRRTFRRNGSRRTPRRCRMFRANCRRTRRRSTRRWRPGTTA